jgi:hypothetical protein
MALGFDVLQPGVENLFDTVQFSAPQITHVVEALVNGIEAPPHGAEPGVKVHEKQRKHGGIDQYRQADDEIELSIGHGVALLFDYVM